MIGSRTRISRSSIRQNETTGAPVRSEPKLVAALVERGDRQHLGCGDDALAAAAVDSNLEHAIQSQPRGGWRGHRSPHGSGSVVHTHDEESGRA